MLRRGGGGHGADDTECPDGERFGVWDIGCFEQLGTQCEQTFGGGCFGFEQFGVEGASEICGLTDGGVVREANEGKADDSLVCCDGVFGKDQRPRDRGLGE